MAKCPHCGSDHEELMHFCPVEGKPIELGERMVGQTLLERWVIKAALGGSSIGGVYRAEDTQTGETVTIKMLHPSLGRNSEIVDPYLADVNRAAEIQSGSLGRIVEVTRDPSGAPLVIREYLRGQTLEEVMEANPEGMAHPRAVYLLSRLLVGLDALHSADIHNGDLTPRDVFVMEGENGEALVKLAEVGERHIKAALPDEEAEKPENRPYLAPEQVRDGKSEKATDIFACGVILYRLLTGKHPYPEGIPPRPEKIPAFEDISRLNTDCPKAFDYTVRRALALFPRDRFKTPALFADALKSFIPADPVMLTDLVPGVPSEKAPREGETGEEGGSPPGTVPVPFDGDKEQPEAPEAKAEQEPPPEQAAAGATGPAPAPEEQPEATGAQTQATVPQAPRTAPQLKGPGGKQRIEHSEESLAPIMPTRHAKWLVPVAIIGGLIFLGVLARTVYYIVTLEPEDDPLGLSRSPEKKDRDDTGDDEEETSTDEEGTDDEDDEEEASTTAEDASTTQDAASAEPDARATDVTGEQVLVKLKVTPEGAVVTMDGEPVSPPFAWELPADGATHTYKVTAEGYEPLNSKFVADRDRNLEAKLTKLPQVTIELEGVPSGAKVTLDGKTVSAPYAWTFDPSKQPHSYRVMAEGYETFEGAFIPDRDKTLTAKLVKEAEPEPKPTKPPEKKPVKKPTKKPGKKPTKKPGKEKDPGGGFVDEVPF